MKRRAYTVGVLALLGLFLSCGDAEPPDEVIEEDCTNGIDDDQDGARDCADLECAGAPNCDEICDNFQDDDLDGDFDCADSDCNGAPNCIPEDRCGDGIDNDSDGLTDCQDGDCANEPVCQTCDPQNDNCEGESICIGDQCEAAFNRFYVFFGFDLEVGEFNQQGGSWDSNGNPPDPKVELHLNGEKILETPNQSNTFSATYDETVTALILAGSILEARVLDVDGNADDLILSCFADPLSPDLLRGRAVLCEDPGIATLTFRIEPN